MLTSIRGLTAATLSAGLFMTAAPAFAEEANGEAPLGESIVDAPVSAGRGLPAGR